MKEAELNRRFADLYSGGCLVAMLHLADELIMSGSLQNDVAIAKWAMIASEEASLTDELERWTMVEQCSSAAAETLGGS